ncbi:MAG TPA: hypothetical protein DIV47_03275 [Candidatus Pacebacteria bacterium]|nr:hypothetical protein [Candidatus Paceibacterota bacterium]
MPRITPIRWQKFEKFLLRSGCAFIRQKGDHRVYWRKGLKRPIILPMSKDLPIFIIRNNLRTLRIELSEYLKILQQL